MNKHIVLLVDASGSMCNAEKEARETVYSTIKELDKDTHLTVVFFDTDQYNVIIDDRVRNVIPELAYIYKARGCTPITDSVYKAIQDITNSLYSIEQLSEPHKFVIFTDGGENSSRYAKEEDLGEAIEHFSESFGWDFEFIGPESDREEIKRYTERIKIKKENVLLYSDVSEGLREMKNKVVA